jgi:hypothetical protein
MTAAITPGAGRSPGATLVIGIIAGLVIGLVFALVISLIPGWVFTDTGPRAIAFVLLALSTPVVALPLWILAPRLGLDAQRFSWGCVIGAMLFDGTALGFFPDVYGQTGRAVAYVGAALLWTFAWQCTTQFVFEARRAAPGA